MTSITQDPRLCAPEPHDDPKSLMGEGRPTRARPKDAVSDLDDANSIVRVMRVEAGSRAMAFLLAAENGAPTAHVADKYDGAELSFLVPTIADS